MRTPACVAACLLLFSTLGAPSESASFAGTWEAAFEGKVFLVLKIQAGQKISGTLNAGSIRLSDEGELVEARPVELQFVAFGLGKKKRGFPVFPRTSFDQFALVPAPDAAGVQRTRGLLAGLAFQSEE